MVLFYEVLPFFPASLLSSSNSFRPACRQSAAKCDEGLSRRLEGESYLLYRQPDRVFDSRGLTPRRIPRQAQGLGRNL